MCEFSEVYRRKELLREVSNSVCSQGQSSLVQYVCVLRGIWGLSHLFEHFYPDQWFPESLMQGMLIGTLNVTLQRFSNVMPATIKVRVLARDLLGRSSRAEDTVFKVKDA